MNELVSINKRRPEVFSMALWEPLIKTLPGATYIPNPIEANRPGFSIKLKTGYKISIQYGPRTYSRYSQLSLSIEQQEAYDVETAILFNGEFVEYKGDEVQGHQTVDEVIETIMIWNNVIVN